MRIFTERDERSPFAGEHIIYENVEEFKKERGEFAPLKKWGSTEITELTAGEWVICDDGYIIQILRTKHFINQNGSYTYFIRVPMGTFAVYWTKSKGWVWRQLYAQFSSPQKSSVSHRSRLSTPGMIQKIKFATLCISGIPLAKAVKITFPNLIGLTYNQLLIKAARLMEDQVVRKEMVDQLSKFHGDISDIFSDKKILSELESLLDRSKKGTDSHRNNIQFIMELRGLITPQTSKKRSGRVVEETNYVEVPPSEG